MSVRVSHSCEVQHSRPVASPIAELTQIVRSKSGEPPCGGRAAHVDRPGVVLGLGLGLVTITRIIAASIPGPQGPIG